MSSSQLLEAQKIPPAFAFAVYLSGHVNDSQEIKVVVVIVVVVGFLQQNSLSHWNDGELSLQ
jgi:hypothetical protein